MSSKAPEERVPVLIVGDSGTGKSTGIATLPPGETVVLNAEEKTLPFPHQNDYKVVDIKSYKMLDSALRYYEQHPEKYKYLVLDSLTSVTEIVDRYTNAMFSGYETWKQYSLLIQDVLIRLKRLEQQVFVIAIPETKDVEFGEKKKFAKIKGKELKYGFIEAQFAIVLYTLPQYSEDDGEMEDVFLQFKPNKNNTAKAPVGLFSTKPKNDYMFIATRIKEFFKGRADGTRNVKT